MDIESMKKLEDLKSILGDLVCELDELIKFKKINCINVVKSEFTDFFKGKGFQVSSNGNSLIASYGSLVASLSHKNIYADYMGCAFSFNLNLVRLNNNEYTIMLNDKSPSLKSTPSTRNPGNVDLQKEIYVIQKAIETAQERINTFSHDPWRLFLKVEDQPSNGTEPESFLSMYALLKSIMQ